MNRTQVNPKFKDSLFRLVFRGKEELLSLYNAVNGSDYQSTFNPNIPLRGIFYHSRVLRNHVEEMSLDIYSRKQLVLPMPIFVVFYNGTEHQEDRKILKLSDLFSKPPADFPFPPALECTAIMLNINYGHNKELMERFRKLEEYAFFVDQMRKLHTQGLTLEAAADEAIRVSLAQGVLTEILRKNRAEVKDLILTEYNEELHIKNEKDISFEEGVQKGRLLERQETRKKTRKEDIDAFIRFSVKRNLPENETLDSLAEIYSISKAEAAKHLNDYHKAHPQ